MNQTELTEYTAGMFDGDGTIAASVTTSDSSPTEHRIYPECNITNRYVAGLLDAEGCVKPVIVQRDNSATNYHIDPECRMTNNKESLMERLSDYADSMNLKHSVYHHDGEGNRDATFQFDIRSTECVRRFLTAVKPYLVVKREQAEIMLNDILPLLESGAQGNRRGFLRIMHHVDRLNSLKGGTRGKYNLEYFEELWGMKYDPTRYD